jgi:hypothetical protein
LEPARVGCLTGKIRRGKPIESGRIASGGAQLGPEFDDEHLYTVVDVLETIAGKLAS